MSDGVLFSFLLLSAIAFALVYHPLLAKQTAALVSPYAKADMTRRVSAALIDGMLVASALFLYNSLASWRYVLVGGGYLLLRDAMAGRSVGKFLCSLMVINLETGRPCGCGASIRRNALLLLPGANAVAAFLEAGTVIKDPQGRRLGDRIALTQVVEGFGAKEVVTAVQESLLDFLAQFSDKLRKPGRASRESVVLLARFLANLRISMVR